MLEGRALVAGSIYVDKTAGSLHPQYGGYFGHLRGVGGLYNWDDPVNPDPYPVSDPAEMSEWIKRVARFYGADLVGISELDERWVYSHYFDRAAGAYGELDIPYQYAIVLGIEMDWEGINQSPGFAASAATALAYSRMAEVAPSLAKYIRALGYPAVPCGNDTAQSIPLAIDAGLGELGRLGLLISPEFGPRQRLCKVLTDLPLQPDQPIDFGLQKFCEGCKFCASNCPAKAIPFGDRSTEPTSISNRTGILRWTVDVGKCFLFWVANGGSLGGLSDCANCVRACPWSSPVRTWL
jgi:epoxyqueuosine reductase